MVSFLSLKGKVWSGYILAFLLLLISYFLIFYTLKKSVQETESVTHTYSVINKLESLKGEIVQAESSVRGFVVTHDERFLEPYNNALENIPVIYKDLKQLTSDNVQQQRDVDTIKRFIDEKLYYLSNGLRMFRANGLVITDNMRRSREASKNVMDNIRTFSANLKANEEQLMIERKKKLSGFFDSTQIIAMISLMIAFITLFYSLIVFNKENKAKELAIERATKYSKDLEQNIGELKHINHELQEFKNVEKFTATGRIARTIAHEVRNPLTNISLATEQLQETASQNQDNAVLLDMIIRNTNRINQLVAELLNATRFANLEFQKAGITEIMESTLEMAKDRMELNHIRVEKHYTTEQCIVNVDIEKIKLALLNIIVNAIEAMEKNKGLLIINTRKQSSKCIIEIKDNGKGMNDDVLQNLFEPYFTAKLNGNGLGLTNTQNIIFNHKGSIKVYSKPGEGATFIIMLNLADVNL
jgi:signal transduction histidine kinase